MGILGAVVVVALIVGGVLFVEHKQNSTTSSPTGVTLTTTPAATATPSQHVAFQDSLASNSNGWNEDANCFFGAGGYHIKGGYICYAPTNTVGNGTISVDTKQISGDLTLLHGITLHRASKGNYYSFGIDGNGKWDFYKSVNDQGTEVLSPSTSSAIKTGLNASNTLKVTMSGSTYTFYINGTQVGSTDDSTFTTGDSGLDGQDGIEVVYANFKITTPGN